MSDRETIDGHTIGSDRLGIRVELIMRARVAEDPVDIELQTLYYDVSNDTMYQLKLTYTVAHPVRMRLFQSRRIDFCIVNTPVVSESQNKPDVMLRCTGHDVVKTR